MNLKLSIFILLFLTLSACQTPLTKSYQALTLGMEKTDVLEIMGNPTRTRRIQDKDRWSYVFYDNDIRLEKEVHFFQGNVVYLGDPPAPKISAEEQDHINSLKDKPESYRDYMIKKELSSPEVQPSPTPKFESVN